MATPTTNTTPTTPTPLPNTPLNSPITNPAPVAPAITAPTTSTTPVINANTIGTQTPIAVPTTPTTPTPTTPTPVNQAEQLYNSLQTSPTAAQNTQTSLVQNILNNLSQTSGETAFKTQAQTDAGVFTKQADYKKVSDEIAARQAQQAQELGSIGKSPMSFAARSGYESAVNAAANSDILALNAKAQAIAGDYQMAIDTAQRAVDVKYAPIKEQLAIQQAQLTAIAPLLTADEKKQAAIMQIGLDQAKTDQAKKIADEKELKTLITTATGFQAPASLVAQANKIAESNDPQAYYKTVALLGKYLTDPTERSYKIAQTQKLLADAKAANVGDPYETLSYAQQYADTGKIPTGLPKGTFGSVAQLAKDLPKQNGQVVSTTTGIKSSKLTSTQEDGIVALYDLTKKIDELKTMYPDSNKNQSNKIAYNGLRNEIVDLIARARTGAAISANEEALYKAKVPPPNQGIFSLYAPGKMDAFKNSLEGKLDTTLRANDLSIYGYSKVKIGDQEYKVGDVIDNGQGQQGRINADGTITMVQ